MTKLTSINHLVGYRLTQYHFGQNYYIMGFPLMSRSSSRLYAGLRSHRRRRCASGLFWLLASSSSRPLFVDATCTSALGLLQEPKNARLYGNNRLQTEPVFKAGSFYYRLQAFHTARQPVRRGVLRHRTASHMPQTYRQTLYNLPHYCRPYQSSLMYQSFPNGYKQQVRFMSPSSSPNEGPDKKTTTNNEKDKVNDEYDDTDDNDQEIVDRTRTWVRRIVIGLNLCPFADRPFRDSKIKITVLRGCDEHDILSLVLAELLLLAAPPSPNDTRMRRMEEDLHQMFAEKTKTGESDQSQETKKTRKEFDTTLVVCPDCYPEDFESYLDLVNMIENGLFVDHPELQGVVQVAPFHPQFVFEGGRSSEDDDDATVSPDNWTNRSPYPIFHLLKESDVSRAVDRLDGDASLVWQRNVDLLVALEKELGRKTFEDYFTTSASDPPQQNTVKSLLREHRSPKLRKEEKE